MREARTNYLQVRVTEKEKARIKSLQNLLNEETLSELIMKAIAQYVQSRVNVNFDELKNRKDHRRKCQ